VLSLKQRVAAARGGMNAALSTVFKIVLVGPEGAGKTSLCERFNGSYKESSAPLPTVGVDFCQLRPTDADGNAYQLQLWDTAGGDRYEKVVDSYFRQAHAFIAVVDLYELETQAHVALADAAKLVRHRLRMLYRALEMHDHSRQEPPRVCILGNKWDTANAQWTLDDMRGRAELRRQATALGATYWDVSARDNLNTRGPFEALVRLLIEDEQHRRRTTAAATRRPMAPEWARWNEALADGPRARSSCCC
jgi:small GTP-binding protein